MTYLSCILMGISVLTLIICAIVHWLQGLANEKVDKVSFSFSLFPFTSKKWNRVFLSGISLLIIGYIIFAINNQDKLGY